VYFNEEEIADYLVYIRQFQDEKLLNKEIEFLELEELQGVSGLKAVRVGIKITKKPKSA
jgi:aminoglycoside phosphotransferase family enzyme